MEKITNPEFCAFYFVPVPYKSDQRLLRTDQLLIYNSTLVHEVKMEHSRNSDDDPILERKDVYYYDPEGWREVLTDRPLERRDYSEYNIKKGHSLGVIRYFIGGVYVGEVYASAIKRKEYIMGREYVIGATEDINDYLRSFNPAKAERFRQMVDLITRRQEERDSKKESVVTPEDKERDRLLTKKKNNDEFKLLLKALKK